MHGCGGGAVAGHVRGQSAGTDHRAGRVGLCQERWESLAHRGWQEAGMASLSLENVRWPGVALGRWRPAATRAVPRCRCSMRLSGCGCAGRVWSRSLYAEKPKNPKPAAWSSSGQRNCDHAPGERGQHDQPPPLRKAGTEEGTPRPGRGQAPPHSLVPGRSHRPRQQQQGEAASPPAPGRPPCPHRTPAAAPGPAPRQTRHGALRHSCPRRRLAAPSIPEPRRHRQR